MSRFVLVLPLAALLAAGATFTGCSKDQPAAPAAKTAASPAAELAAGKAEGLAALSEADRAAAVAQKVCPVSGQALGEMGTPLKVTVNGRDVFLCCPSCEESLRKDPDKYFAKLDAK